MNYAKVENGQVISTNLPRVGKLKSGQTISGYHLMSEDNLKLEGWLPLEDNKPTYNESTEYLQFKEYVVHTDKVVMVYEVVEKELPDLETLKQQKINESKTMLEKYLADNPFQFTDGKHYTVTKDKQALLTSVLAIHDIKTRAGMQSILEWNAVGEECDVWTVENLSILAMGIADYVKPFVSKQQVFEVVIRNSATIEELNSVVIDYAN